MIDRLLEAREVAELLHVPERWVREHTRSGTLPHVRLGRYRRYRRDAVLAWVEAQEVGGAAGPCGGILRSSVGSDRRMTQKSD
jgi:excisionase family DNA binding protein